MLFMMEKLSIYIHIPFCVRKCEYCDFYSTCDMSCRNAFVRALLAQIKSFRSAAKNRIVDTIYFGGGTPSLLAGEDIVRILQTVRSVFRVSDEAEITMEANPGTLDPEKLSARTYDPVRHTYIKLGEKVGNAFSDGKKLI